MESEIIVKAIEWKEGNGLKGPWRMLQLTDNSGMIYSAFSNQISGEAMEVINRIKPNDALKIAYEMAKTKAGKDVRNLKGIIEHEPSVSERMDNGAKEEVTDKDRRISRLSCLSTAARALQGSTGLIARDVVEMAKVFEQYVYGEDDAPAE